MPEQGRTYINRRTVARAVRQKTVTARLRAVVHSELRRAKAALPRGKGSARVRGRATAAALIDALSSALQNRTTAIATTSGRLIRRLTRAGHLDLPRTPCERTILAALRLLADATPLVSCEGRTWTVYLGGDEDPDELEHELRSWREAKNAPEAPPAEWLDVPIGELEPAAESAEFAEIHDATGARDSCDSRTPVSNAKPPRRPRNTRPRRRSPRVRARAGAFQAGRPGAFRSARVEGLLAEVGHGRWMRRAAAACLEKLGHAKTLDAVWVLIAWGEHDELGRRGRWALRRALDRLAAIGWLVEDDEGWTVRRREPPAEDRPIMGRLVAPPADVVDPPGMSWERVCGLIRKHHGAKTAYRFQATGGDGDLVKLSRQASDRAMADLGEVIEATKHPAALSRRICDHLRGVADDERRATPQREMSDLEKQLEVAHKQKREAFLASIGATWPG